MKSLAQLKKEKHRLTRYIGQCEYYLLHLKDRTSSHDASQYAPLVSRYHKLIEAYRNRLVIVNSLIRNKNRTLLVSSVTLAVLLLSFIFLNPAITGNVIFGETQSSSTILDREFNQSVTIPLDAEGPISTIALTGTYTGSEWVRAYVETEESDYLVFATDTTGEFSEECGSACYLPPDSYRLRIELAEGARLRIDRISYALSSLKEFVLSSIEEVYTLEEERFIRNRFTIFNPQKEAFTLAIYGEGELTEYLTLNTSITRFDADTESIDVRYDLDLLRLAPGQYQQDIVVRFLPSETFTGEAPTEVHRISVSIPGEQASPSFRWWPIAVLGIILIGNIVFFLHRKKSNLFK